MTELVRRFREDILIIEGERTPLNFKQANADLQSVYAFHLSSRENFKPVEYFLKNLYKSFNFAVATVNDALKRHSMTSEASRNLDECLEAMISCCDKIVTLLSAGR